MIPLRSITLLLLLLGLVPLASLEWAWGIPLTLGEVQFAGTFSWNPDAPAVPPGQAPLGTFGPLLATTVEGFFTETVPVGTSLTMAQPALWDPLYAGPFAWQLAAWTLTTTGLHVTGATNGGLLLLGDVALTGGLQPEADITWVEWHFIGPAFTLPLTERVTGPITMHFNVYGDDHKTFVPEASHTHYLLLGLFLSASLAFVKRRQP